MEGVGAGWSRKEHLPCAHRPPRGGYSPSVFIILQVGAQGGRHSVGRDIIVIEAGSCYTSDQGGVRRRGNTIDPLGGEGASTNGPSFQGDLHHLLLWPLALFPLFLLVLSTKLGCPGNS